MSKEDILKKVSKQFDSYPFKKDIKIFKKKLYLENGFSD